MLFNEKGRIIGVAAENGDGEIINIKAKAVVLATGGFLAEGSASSFALSSGRIAVRNIIQDGFSLAS